MNRWRIAVLLLLSTILPVVWTTDRAVAGVAAAEAEVMEPTTDGADPATLVEAEGASFEQWLAERLQPLGSFLGKLHNPIDAFFDALPMWVGTAAAVTLFVLAGVWVWSLRREFIFRGAPDQAPWRDLRIWATLLLIPYVAVYLIFR